MNRLTSLSVAAAMTLTAGTPPGGNEGWGGASGAAGCSPRLTAITIRRRSSPQMATMPETPMITRAIAITHSGQRGRTAEVMLTCWPCGRLSPAS